ncbi:MAG TPA: TonB-dependent receptor [Terracidiphilus sp.]|nr:TonB-dependent receptor [Terracidiphilus sp.]
MRPAFYWPLLTAVCFLWHTELICAQQNFHASAPEAGRNSIAAESGRSQALGRVEGVVRDPSGAVVQLAKIELVDPASGFKASAATDASGKFVFRDVPSGRYQLTATAQGFADDRSEIDVAAGSTTANLTLRIASTHASIEVKSHLMESASATLVEPGMSDQGQSSNTAELLARTPGVTLRQNGTLGTIPLLNGLGDERTRLVVEGMTVSSSCPNHMNPPSSYIVPAHAARMTVMPGVTPVSVGGDSLGGTVTIDSTDPAFAQAGERFHTTVDSSGFYRSNSDAYGGSFIASMAGRSLGLGYSASWATNDDYFDGSGHKVTSTYAQTTEQTVTLSARARDNFVSVQAGLHHVPYEGFPSAQMDMVRDLAESVNVHYRRSLEHGAVDSYVYWQGASHSMNIGKDKSSFPMPMWMPMNTHGRDYGYSIRLDQSIAARHHLRAGNELHRFVLDDTWPAVAGTAPGMGPDSFIDINNGRRTRLGWFGELTSEWSPRWTTLFGLRNDTVWMNTDPVHGYSMMYAADAMAFNVANRAHTDVNFDATAWTRYEPSRSTTFEIGFARKTRAPNLYERYAWSTSKMVSGMIGWFADGNYYVGNLALRPEVAHTVNGTAMWHDAARANWEIKLTPYFTSLHDFVDVDTLRTYKYSKTTLAQLRFSNHDARIAGIDLSGARGLWQNQRLGAATITALAGWQRGERDDTSNGLYQMMPVHARMAFEERKSGLMAGFGIEAVDRKSDTDTQRYEQTTPGYTLFDLHGAYERRHLHIAAAADNLLNRFYELPLGGVNFDDFMASGRTGQIRPLTGRGRSMFVSLSVQF